MFSSPISNIERSGIQPGMKVADFGSGVGFYSIPLCKAVTSSGKVYAIDVQKDLLLKLKKESEDIGLNNLEIIWADLDKHKGTGLKDGICDRVLLANTLFQVEDRDAVLDESNRILRSSGEMILIDWSASYGGMGPSGDHVLTKDSAITLCQSHGFELKREFDAGDQHYGLIFKKK